MKYKIIALLLFLGLTKVHAQNNYSYDYKIVYKLNYKPSLNFQSKETDYFALYTNPTGSEFESIGIRVRDSLNFNKDENLSISEYKAMIPEHKFKYVLYYDLNNKMLTMTRRFINVAIGYKEKSNLQWKLTEENAEIKGYSCQKAMVEYEGRTYEAWFTLAIPIQEGPYKFKGLPGLIIQIADLEDEYNFEFMSLKKLNPNPSSFYEQKEFEIGTKENFREVRKSYTQNPFSMISQSGITIDINPADKARMQEEHKKSLLKKNNTIEKQ